MVIVYLCSFYTMLVLACFVWDTVKIPWSMFRNKPVKFSTAEYLMDRRDWKEALIFTVIFAIGIAGILPSLFGPGEDCYTAEEVDQAYEDGYNYARRDFIECPYCGDTFPCEYAFRNTTQDPQAYAEEAAQEAVMAKIQQLHPEFIEENQTKLEEIYAEVYDEAYSYASSITCPRCVYSAYRDIISGESGKCNQCGNFYWIDDSYHEIGLCFDCGQHVAVECRKCHRMTIAWQNQDDFAVCADCMGILMEDWSISHAINNRIN